MKEHLIRRLIDLATVAIGCLAIWALYSGIGTINKVNQFYDGQCAIIQEQALEAAVEERLSKIVPEGPMDTGEVKE